MNKIYVGNLPFKATESELQELFEQFGEIKEAVIIKDRYTEESKGFGFVTFDSPQAAQNALKMDGKDLSGRSLKVNMAKEERRTSGGGGGGGGRRSGGGGGGFRGRESGGRGGRGGW